MRRLLDPLGAADPTEPHRELAATDVRLSRIQGPCPDADARWARFRISYRVVPRDENAAPVSAIRIVEGTFRDGFVEGRFVVFERERAVIDGRTYEVLLFGYGAMNGERGEVLEPTAFFRFERPGVRNRTRASLPLGDGRHRDYIYQGATLTTTAEWKGFALDGEVVHSAYRNPNGVLMPEERERYPGQQRWSHRGLKQSRCAKSSSLVRARRFFAHIARTKLSRKRGSGAYTWHPPFENRCPFRSCPTIRA